jgi:hypothetical protein
VIDPVSNVVLQADTSNVDAVMVAGRFLKRDGNLLAGDLRSARDEIAASLEYLMKRSTSSRIGSRRAARAVTHPDLARSTSGPRTTWGARVSRLVAATVSRCTVFAPCAAIPP